MTPLSEPAHRLLAALWAGAVIVADGMRPMLEPQGLPGRRALPVAQGHLRELIEAGLVKTYTGGGNRWVETIDEPTLTYMTAACSFGES